MTTMACIIGDAVPIVYIYIYITYYGIITTGIYVNRFDPIYYLNCTWKPNFEVPLSPSPTIFRQNSTNMPIKQAMSLYESRMQRFLQ